MSLRAILFDHDGTLVDSEPLHFSMWTAVLEPFGVSLSEEQYKTHYAGVPTQANAVDLVERFGLNEDPAALAEAKNRATNAFLRDHAFPLMPGVTTAVTEFRRAGLVLAVVTGASAHGVEATLDKHRLRPHFSTIVSGDDVTLSKPAPDCYRLALQRLGLQASECLAIEDTQSGLDAASGAGIRCVTVPTAMSRHHDFGRAEAVLGNMAQAVAYVRQRFLVQDEA